MKKKDLQPPVIWSTVYEILRKSVYQEHQTGEVNKSCLELVELLKNESNLREEAERRLKIVESTSRCLVQRFRKA